MNTDNHSINHLCWRCGRPFDVGDICYVLTGFPLYGKGKNQYGFCKDCAPITPVSLIADMDAENTGIVRLLDYDTEEPPCDTDTSTDVVMSSGYTIDPEDDIPDYIKDADLLSEEDYLSKYVDDNAALDYWTRNHDDGFFVA